MTRVRQCRIIAQVSIPMLTIVETSAFARRAGKLLSTEEHEELIFYLALHPQSGDEIPGTGGVRKVRFAARGKGKSGGVRVIYYFFDEENPLYAIFLYGKNEQANLTPKQKREVSAFAATLKAAAKVRRIKLKGSNHEAEECCRRTCRGHARGGRHRQGRGRSPPPFTSFRSRLKWMCVRCGRPPASAARSLRAASPSTRAPCRIGSKGGGVRIAQRELI